MDYPIKKEIKKIVGRKQYEEHRRSVGLLRYQYERGLADRRTLPCLIDGFCDPCNTNSQFLMDLMYSDNIIPNYRERLVCKKCGLNNRQRFMASYILDVVRQSPEIKTIYAYEQVTPFFNYLKIRFPEKDIIGSEYLGYEKKSGEIIQGLRHEDALNLSFNNESLDIILSNEVFEHVPNIQRSLDEAFRVLKTNGRLIFSIPFCDSENSTRQRAILLENGSLKYLLPEAYHGNPVSEKGSLVFFDIGWDILKMCKMAGFNDAYLVNYYSESCLYLGGTAQIIFVAEKSKRPLGKN